MTGINILRQVNSAQSKVSLTWMTSTQQMQSLATASIYSFYISNIYLWSSASLAVLDTFLL